MAKQSKAVRRKQDYSDRYIIRMQGGKTGLVEATSKMDISEFRVFATALTMILPDDEDFTEYEIRVNDIIKLFDLPNDGRYYEIFKDATLKIMERKFVIYEQKEDGIEYKTTIPLIIESSEPVPVMEQNRIRLQFHPKLKPYLLELQREYLTVDIRNITDLGSQYSVKLYFILKHQQRLGNKKVRYEVSRLRTIFGLEDNEYSLYGNFKQKIIQKGIKDINKHTDLRVTKIEEHKKVRAIEAITFYLEEGVATRQTVLANTKPKRQVVKSSNGKVVISQGIERMQANDIIEAEVVEMQDEDITSIDNTVVEALYAKVKKYKISKSTIKSWLEELPLEQVQMGIDYVLEKIKAGDSIKNIGGYINNMVRTPSLFELKQEQQQQQKQHRIEQHKQQVKAQEEQNFEKQKNDLLNMYTQAKISKVIELFAQHDELAGEYIRELEQEASKDKPRFLDRMAWDKFSEVSKEGSDYEQLMTAIDKAGFSFRTHVGDWMTERFSDEIETINQQFHAQAEQLGINLV